MTVDKFGFRIGSKRSLAARLYETGATQSEMISATGTTQYNMLKDAEQRGHRVVVKGDRYYLFVASSQAEIEGRLQTQKTASSSRRSSAKPADQLNAHEPVPAILSIIGWHAKESPADIVERKSEDIAKAGVTIWVIQSWKAKTDTVQAFGSSYPGVTVYFIAGGAIPTGTAQAANQMSEDKKVWTSLPRGIGKVTGRLSGATGLVLDQLELCSDLSIDLWRFAEHPIQQPLRFMQGASTACVVPAGKIADGMVARHRRIVAMGRLAEPFAVYLR